MGGQIRAVPGVVLGWDMSAALAMAAALGIDLRAAAELLPVIEAVMVRRLNDACAAVQDGSSLGAET